MKELFLRGAWRITDVQRRRLRKPVVMVEPNYQPPGPLPSPLDIVDGVLRRRAPAT